ncbi:uncharacterized protein LOC124365485 [Homalodisca vitripennis]|uniref:uncharacterized protein LOC124365485 n=1 Tax=Homalodisca vitripennis TaxID=197043 RepID=UPI001EEA55FC|nr:uncharacterized protein LOC124365485 [Homalodisca vitripennis]
MYSHGQATAVRYYNGTNIIPLFREIKRFFMMKRFSNFSSHHVGSFFNKEKFFVTDIGMPGVLSADFPTLSSFRSKSNGEASNASVDIRYWSQGSNVLKVKNTIVNIWQGIIKSHVSRFVSTFGLNSNTTNGLEMKFSFIPTDIVGFKWYTTTDVFTNN